ncbi:HAD family phosphatase [Amnibacterium sp. CER49]|uniref:HAD family hydrolase n=1 Tax=Amnibacterium sp. CER49 TaxID=3039161 RepID=UPI002448233F|nr:HAD family phosphatase [Amnibacterium sp. CER49]MDH2443565.1 HAD family phosphatase [Amnibacterium sp. CER49]
MHLPLQVSAVVFDLDGLLVDTESAWLRAEAELFAKHGVPFGPLQQAELVGLALPDLLARLRVALDVDAEQTDALRDELERRVTRFQGEPRLMPGAGALVRRLAGRVPLAIATNSGRDALEAALGATGLRRCFPVTVTADDVERPKPAPEPYLAAFAALDADPRRGVVFEDSAPGAAAGRRAGATVVTVPAGGAAEPQGHLTLASLEDQGLARWSERVRAIRERRPALLVPATA